MLLTLLVLAPFSVAAAEEMDDVLGGFDDADDVFAGFDDGGDFPDTLDENAPDFDEPWWHVAGDLGLAIAVGLHDHESATGADYGGLQRMRTKLSLQFDANLPAKWKLRISGYGFYDASYRIRGRDRYRSNDSEVLDHHEYDVQLGDSYLEGSLHDSIDLKVGRQVVNWGRSESLRVLDVINPLDNRDPGLVDIEDSRLPLAMVRLGFFSGPWALTALIIPEIRFDFLPAYGSDFYPTIPLPEGFNGETKSDERKPADFSKDTEYALNLTGTFSGWDVSFQVVYFWNDSPDLRSIAFTPERIDTTFGHARLWMVGGGANYTIGSWLFKAELAYLDGFQYFSTTEEKSRIDAMAGVEFYGFNDFNIVLEIAHRHIHDFEKEMKDIDLAQRNRLEAALRISWDLFNQQLHLVALGLALGETAQDGSFVRISAKYDVMDAFSVEMGFLLFQNGDNVFFRNVGQNDRFFAGAKYSF